MRTNKTEKTQKCFAAEIAGNAAFKAGKKRIPCQDSNLMDLLEGLMVGDCGAAIMQAWYKGWDIANLAA